MSRYNEDLDYLIQDVDISKAELEEIIAEADKIISEINSERDKLLEAYLKKVQCLQKLDKDTESKEFIDKLLELNSDMPEAIMRLGIFYDTNKEYDKAITYKNKVIEIKPDYAAGYRSRGYTKFKLSDNSGAIADFDKAIENKPDYAVAYNSRGYLYYCEGNINLAIENYDKAIEFNPKYDLAKTNRLRAYDAKDENQAVKLIDIRKNKLHMDKLKDNIEKVIPFIGAGVSKAYGYYTWGELLQELFDMCCRIHTVHSDIKKKIQNYIDTEDYMSATSAMDAIFTNISSAVCILIERATESNPIEAVNMRSILSEYLHLFPSKKYLTTNYDTVVQDILELKGSSVTSFYPTSGFSDLSQRKNQKKYDFKNTIFSTSFCEVYYLHGVYYDPASITLSKFHYDDNYGAEDGDININLRRFLPSVIHNIYHNSIFLYIGCGMKVKEDRVLKILRGLYGRLRSAPSSYALLNINEITKTEKLYEKWETQCEEVKTILKEKEEELADMNVRVIWYSAPKNSKDGHESAKRQLLKYILSTTRENVEKEKKERQLAEEERLKQKAQERERLQAELEGLGSTGTNTSPNSIMEVILSEEQLKQVNDLVRGKINIIEITPTKCSIKFPMYKVEGGSYQVSLISENGELYLSDNGTTYTELDKIFELKEPDVIKNLVAILKQYGCRKHHITNACIIECTLESIDVKMSYLIQAISFMLNMKIFYV